MPNQRGYDGQTVERREGRKEDREEGKGEGKARRKRGINRNLTSADERARAQKRLKVDSEEKKEANRADREILKQDVTT